MFPKGARFIQDINEVVRMFPEDKDGEVLSSAEIRPNRQNSGAWIDRLVLSFYGKTYNSGEQFLIREQE